MAQADFLISLTLQLLSVYEERISHQREGQLEAFLACREYGNFTAGAYACGFVCRDLQAEFPFDLAKKRPDLLLVADVGKLRHYIHTLMRNERHSYGHGSHILMP